MLNQTIQPDMNISNIEEDKEEVKLQAQVLNCSHDQQRLINGYQLTRVTEMSSSFDGQNAKFDSERQEFNYDLVDISDEFNEFHQVLISALTRYN